MMKEFQESRNMEMYWIKRFWKLKLVTIFIPEMINYSVLKESKYRNILEKKKRWIFKNWNCSYIYEIIVFVVIFLKEEISIYWKGECVFESFFERKIDRETCLCYFNSQPCLLNSLTKVGDFIACACTCYMYVLYIIFVLQWLRSSKEVEIWKYIG